MIGWERRVLLRHYLEQGMTKTELAERFGISRQTIYRWIRSGELDRDLSAAGVHYSGPGAGCHQGLIGTETSSSADWVSTRI